MKLLDLIVFYFGIYGICWSIIYAKPLKPLKHLITNQSKTIANLLDCIVCTSFWVAIPFTQLYFHAELWFTKVLILFSVITFTWILASILKD